MTELLLQKFWMTSGAIKSTTSRCVATWWSTAVFLFKPNMTHFLNCLNTCTTPSQNPEHWCKMRWQQEVLCCQNKVGLKTKKPKMLRRFIRHGNYFPPPQESIAIEIASINFGPFSDKESLYYQYTVTCM